VVLKRTTNEQRLMGPRPSNGWPNINIFPNNYWGGGRQFFPDIQKVFPTYRNFSLNTKVFPDIS
jgi:hypothetical protein